jgi:hypothetical protein
VPCDEAAVGFTKVRYWELGKKSAQLVTLFALSNLWSARPRLFGVAGRARLHSPNRALRVGAKTALPSK